MSKPPVSDNSVQGQIMYHLNAHPEGIYLADLARRVVFGVPLSDPAKVMRVWYNIWGKWVVTKKDGRVKRPKIRLESQVYVKSVHGSNKLIALKKEGKA